MNNVIKCQWSTKTELEEAYHDTEWGVPVFDDTLLFELLSLELCQSGLSWHTILKKREGYRNAFEQFNIAKVAIYNDDHIAQLVTDENIVRHKAKITAIINNAAAILKVQQEFGSFSGYLWGFVNHQPIVNGWQQESEVPASTPLSDQISKDLKKRGFKFLGSTTVYAFLQAVGIVNDHIQTCFRFKPCCEAIPEDSPVS
ncbi:DNA-3-methyladenine glycosylase I [Bacterioplanoides sp. SCSIO 12839]|uniref:DNA-3-methyladenine glycosylase I n=1 Tax=Bacterioplanoides sp. SCSIO 12839 TaxID=2829569 RepID=UPI002103EBEA|nr:DNA-3-methyladenine glycosylase I [Bacterioplanoides sp. SCSIO 12839]UTW47959.1 DNA-3-methyladenine glycosylase I [Bacterioplanoides sp. SCSIO 12839]